MTDAGTWFVVILLVICITIEENFDEMIAMTNAKKTPTPPNVCDIWK